MEEMRRCGEVLHHGYFGKEGTNHIHVQYANKYDAQRALTRNGRQITSSLIIGVKSIEPMHKQQVKMYLRNHHPAGGGGSSFEKLVRASPTRGQVGPARPHRLNNLSGSLAGWHAGGGSSAIAQPSKGWWSLFKEYVLGT